MSRSRKMIINTLVLTLTAFLMRGVGIVFQAWLTKKIGAAGIGLYQLVMSVSMLASTFAISGIRFATTRLISMELGKATAHKAEHTNAGNFTIGEIQEANCTSSQNVRGFVGSGAAAAMRRCLIYAFCFGVAAFVLLWFGAGYIGGKWIGDTRTVTSLKILSLSLPAFALSAVLGGYFTAVCRVAKTSGVAIFEQLVRIAVIVVALTISASHDLETACAIIVAGGVVGEIVSFVLLFTLYLFERRGFPRTKAPAHSKTSSQRLTARMLGIALPLALSAYARSALSTLQHLLVPRGLKKSGATAETALANYGVVHGMVLPIIMFPSSLFYAFAEMVVPELTDAQMRGDSRRISALVSNSLRLCLLFAVGFMACMWGFGGELGEAVYNNADAGKYITILAWLMPIMYLDSVTDGMLRGLGQQMYSMAYNIFDSVVSVILVWLLLPKYAVNGYIFMIAFTELINFGLSINRLRKVTKIRFPVAVVIKAPLSAFAAINVSLLITRLLGDSTPSVLLLILRMLLCLVIYAVLTFVLGCYNENERKHVKNFLSKLEIYIKSWYATHVKKRKYGALDKNALQK